jgi:hypothetical protein
MYVPAILPESSMLMPAVPRMREELPEPGVVAAPGASKEVIVPLAER